jgi:hypothetical protein
MKAALYRQMFMMGQTAANYVLDSYLVCNVINTGITDKVMVNTVGAQPKAQSKTRFSSGLTLRVAIRALWAISLVTVIVGSLLPDNSAPIVALSATGMSDKFDHFVAYAVLAFLPGLHEHRRVMFSLTVMACVLGVSLEFLQPSFGRDYEFADIVSDTFGMLVGIALALPVRRLFVRP